MRMITRLALATSLVLGLSSRSAFAQDPPAPTGPCRDYPCRILVDWGAGNTAASFPNDRRYGQAADFEPMIRQVLQDNRLRITDGGDAMLITLRPAMKNAMCDQMAGTNTDMSCRTVEELQVQFTSSDPAVKAPNTMRVTNRCGAGDQKMTVAQMARYAGDFVAYQLAADRKGLKRPTAKC